MGRTRWRGGAVALCLVLAAGVFFAVAAGAGASVIAAKNWRVQPRGVVGTVPIVINGAGSFDAYPLDLGTLVLTIDGSSVSRSAYVASVYSGRNLYLYYVPSPPLIDGSHTVNVRIADSAGRVSTYQWSFTIAQPPTAAWLAPAQGESNYDGRPAVALALSDNTPGSLFTVAGEVHAGTASGPVAATFAGASLAEGANTFNISAELAPGMYFLTAAITDSGGVTGYLQGGAARSFVVVAADGMSVFTADCLGCHDGTSHPGDTLGCSDCHTFIYHEYGDCQDCHSGHGGPIDVTGVTGSCRSCHDKDGTPKHTKESVAPAHVSSCLGCHNESLIDRHLVVPEGSTYPYQCDVCHGSTDPDVVAAIATHNTSCEACHSDTSHPQFHTETRASCALSQCHPTTADVLHTTCDVCHALPTLPASTGCLNCHAKAEPHTAYWPLHVGDATGSVVSSWVAGCNGYPDYQGFCHDISNTMQLHANVHNGSDGCPECHGEGKTPSNQCIDCHTEEESSFVHHNNNKFLANPADAAPASYATLGPAGGWSNLDAYDCQWCHWSFFWLEKPSLPEYRTAYAGDSMWYAGLRSGEGGYPTDTTLTVPGVYTATVNTRIEYMVNYQTNVGYDYGYTEVSSDGGTTWVTVPGTITSTDPVSARHLGNGIQGDSVGWVPASFDLSAYAGQSIQVRLRYKTFRTPQRFGYAVDDIRVYDGVTVLFSDGAESASSGITTNGWYRTYEAPVRFEPNDPDNAP